MTVFAVLMVWFLGILTGSAFTAVLLYSVSRRSVFGTLKISLYDPSQDFLTVELHRELKELKDKKEILMKVDRS